MNNRKWTLALAALFLVFLYLLSHFAYSYIKIRGIVSEIVDNPNAKTFARHHIVLISQELDNPFWRTIEQGAEEEAKSFNMDLEYTGPFRLNPEEQTKLLDKAIASKVDGLLVQGLELDEYKNLIGKAIGREQFRPHIVMMDIKMPGIEGLEALRQIKGSIHLLR